MVLDAECLTFQKTQIKIMPEEENIEKIRERVEEELGVGVDDLDDEDVREIDESL